MNDNLFIRASMVNSNLLFSQVDLRNRCKELIDRNSVQLYNIQQSMERHTKGYTTTGVVFRMAFFLCE